MPWHLLRAHVIDSILSCFAGCWLIVHCSTLLLTGSTLNVICSWCALLSMCSTLNVLLPQRALLLAWCSLDVLCYRRARLSACSALGMLYSYVLWFDVARLCMVFFTTCMMPVAGHLCRCCRVASSGTERRSVMDKSAAVFSGSLLNAECAMLVVDAECDALCGLMPLK